MITILPSPADLVEQRLGIERPHSFASCKGAVPLFFVDLIPERSAPLLEPDGPLLTEALRRAIQDGDGSQLLTLSDQYTQRTPDGYQGNQTEALYAVNCADSPG